MTTICDSAAPKYKILIVAPFMHRHGHFSVFPVDLAKGFIANGAEVTLLNPQRVATGHIYEPALETICLESESHHFNIVMRWLWKRFKQHSLLISLAWLSMYIRPGSYDLVYWTDFNPDNQQSTWPLGLASLLGLYRHRTAFTEHHNFSWNKHRWQRLFKLDRIRLRNIEMFVHSKKLLDWIRLNMDWPDKGHFVPWGLWPTPANTEDRRQARVQLGIAENARVLLVFGLQAIRRKQIDTLADAIRGLSLEKPLVILFAGVQVEDAPHPFKHPELTEKHNLQVQHHTAFIEDDAVKALFAAADGVWAYYGFFMGASGVLAQAISFGRMSICASTGESNEICNNYHVGVSTPTDDLDGVKAVISRFINMDASEQVRMETAAIEASHTLAWPNTARQIMNISLAADSRKLGSTPNT